MNIVICRTRFADYNIGERLILRSILEKLSTIRGSQVTVVSNTPKLTNEVHGIRVADCSLVRYCQTASAIRSSDLVMWGGGNMLQEQFTYLHIPYAAKDLLLAKMMGSKIVVYGVEVGPVVSKLGKVMAGTVLRNADMITVRNIESYQEAKALGANEHTLFLTEDLVFSISTSGLPERKEVLERFDLGGKRPMVGICPRIILDRQWGYLPFSLRIKYGLQSDGFYRRRSQVKDFVVQLCRFLVDEANTEVVFLPMDMSDEAFCDEIIDAWGKDIARPLLSSLKLKDVMGLFSLMDLVVSMRLHGLILASTLGIPVIAISGVAKNANFLASLGCEQNNIDIEDLSVERFKDIFHSIWSDREKKREEIQEKVAAVKKKEENNFRLLVSFMEKMA